MLKMTIAFALLFIIEAIILCLLSNYCKKLSDENKVLEMENIEQKNYIDTLVRHAERLQEICTDKNRKDKEIKGATDEEIKNIVSNIISINNSRM